ncbi:DUF6452 family protein [Frigoriflavimonas asaccharolytica]|uniref:Lipoprotein n=1 Tax=Frigoriflavimonas asaccharolytica TaxID=2735899 RepID=A0A8J8K9J6_9FLAO|nr:DUF6452 family protein [Frigoriflavimonas asaccharolytica]NRS93873.1 hypothetical protein [Frigoriflavimonas asaccharolytica]
MNRIFFLLLIFFFSVSSCASEDDICLSADTTARLKVKFKTSEGKLKTLDSVYVNVDYGNGLQEILATQSKTDSLLIPLRIDESVSTDIYVSTSKIGPSSKIKIKYTTTSEYVSTACGIKKIYNNIEPILEISNEVKSIEKNQTQIADEAKTHIFLIF